MRVVQAFPLISNRFLFLNPRSRMTYRPKWTWPHSLIIPDPTTGLLVPNPAWPMDFDASGNPRFIKDKNGNLIPNPAFGPDPLVDNSGNPKYLIGPDGKVSLNPAYVDPSKSGGNARIRIFQGSSFTSIVISHFQTDLWVDHFDLALHFMDINRNVWENVALGELLWMLPEISDPCNPRKVIKSLELVKKDLKMKLGEDARACLGNDMTVLAHFDTFKNPATVIIPDICC